MYHTYYVSKQGSDSNCGDRSHPFFTINCAAQVALPGDTVIVQEGTYREWVNPLFGGDSDTKRITYMAEEGKKVVIKGSEQIRSWVMVSDNIWKGELDNQYFGAYNPYADVIYGDWYNTVENCHTGEVYLNGQSLYEVDQLEKLDRPVFCKKNGISYLPWYCTVDEHTTTIYANFGTCNPNEELAEIHVRPCCFFPTQTGIHYITVRGFELCHAATQWAPPTAEQIGLIGPHWSKGWIIEDNIIHDSKCVGVSLGKERSTGHNWGVCKREKAGFNYQLESVFRAVQIGWSKDLVGSHIVRNNQIYNCEQAGIVGHMGCAFSHIVHNHIHHINCKEQIAGAEIAGIKFHAGIDAVIQKNRIDHCRLGIWLDWQNQGSRLTQNLLYENDEDILIEVCHGPCLIDNNLLLSPFSLNLLQQGLAVVHNLIAGSIDVQPVPNRATPYHFPHSTQVLGTELIFAGDDRYYNNIFINPNHLKPDAENEGPALEASGSQDHVRGRFGLDIYNAYSPSKEEYDAQVKQHAATYGVGTVRSFELSKQPIYAAGNVYCMDTTPCRHEGDRSLRTSYDLPFQITEDKNRVLLTICMDPAWEQCQASVVDTTALSHTRISSQAYENPDGSPIVVDQDYWGNQRTVLKNVPGPFAHLITDNRTVTIWE